MVSLVDFLILGALVFVFISPVLYAFISGRNSDPAPYESDVTNWDDDGGDDS